jgi:hypothetical protein
MIGEYGAFGGMKIGRRKLKQTDPIAIKQIIVKEEKCTVHLDRCICYDEGY